jgi:hypothetical protein
MASEGTRQGTNRDGEREAPDKQARLPKGCGILVSPYRIVIIRDGQFVKAARRQSKAL